ncbi:IS1380-Spn1 transposase [Streptococcus pneumoniae]|nr:IS1380-Spn1 transposase [Streptococcus pneumoniae]
MRKIYLSIFTSLLLMLGLVNVAQADEYLRIGMEAAYAPFNWTQDDDSNGAVKIDGTNQYANGYDVQIAKKIAKDLGKEPLVVKTKWEGLVPALTSGKIDMIIAGMSPTAERKQEIAFSSSYYTSEPVLLVKKDSAYASAKSLDDFNGAKITSQQGVYLYDLIAQIPGAKKETAMGDFAQMRQALEAGVIDAYVSERPEALTAEAANSKFKMIQVEPGFKTGEEDTAIAIGLRKNDNRISQINASIETISKDDQVALMDRMIKEQPAEATTTEETSSSFFSQVAKILSENWQQLLRGAGITLLISIVGTIIGLIIGLAIGVFRTAPLSENKAIYGLQKLVGWVLNVYIEIFRGTPMIVQSMVIYYPQLFTPNLKTIQNPCLSLDPGWFLFSPNGCFLLDKKEFPLYGISVEKNTKRKETHMNSLPNHHFQNKSFYQLSFDGGHLTQYGGLIFFQELFSQLKLKERISKYLVTNDQRRYCRYSDSDILVQFLFQLLTGYGTDYACKELSADAYFPKLLEGGQLASQPTLSRFLSRTDEETVHSLRCLNLELVEFFLQFHQLNQLIVDIDSTHFTTYGKQEGVAYNAHYRAHGYHPLYAFEGKTGYCFNAQLRPGNRYCSEEADSFITPVLERFNQLLFRMDSGFATPKLYDLIEKTGQYYLIKLKKNTVLSRLGDLSLPCPQDEDLTILPHSAYSETLYQAGSWSHKRRVCQFSERKEGNLFYDVISLVTNMTSGTSQDQFQLYRGRGQAENFIKEMKEGFFGDKTDSSSLIKNEVRMMISCIAYNLYLFLKHLAGGDFQTLTIKRFRHLFLHVVGKCVRTGRKQLLKLSSLYAYSELFSALYSRIRKVNLNLPIPYEPPGRKASLMMH